jgi:hypothetical protein
MDKDRSARRISLISVGAGLAAMSGFLGLIAYGLMMLFTNPNDDFWKTLKVRAESNPILVVLIVMSAIGVLIGVAMIAGTLFGSGRTSTSSRPKDR